MSPIVTPTRPRRHAHDPAPASATRRDQGSTPSAPRNRQGTGPAPGPTGARPVLLAGADPRRRAQLRAEIGATLTRRTAFTEADAVCDVLERASTSRLVILAGDLADGSAESLVRLLGLRHPQLPVVSIESGMRHPCRQTV
jgi:hypothetical protein